MVDFIKDLRVPSPVKIVKHNLLATSGIQLSAKREDLIHEYVSGNKWRKLKYNLEYTKANNIKKIITFGGPFSNHIHATAAACKYYNLESIGLIRGEYDPLNPTLQFAQSCGMNLEFIDRTSYRQKENSKIVQNFLSTQESYYLIPEGGSNDLAYEGLQELSEEINQSNFDIILVSAGTGGTATGIIKHLNPSKELWIFSSLKSDYLHQEILKNLDPKKHHQLKFISSYHYGGYGKSPESLIEFINTFSAETQIPIDPIYNGKLISGFLEMVVQGQIDNSKSYLWIHTGGLQGITAYNYMAKKKGKLEIVKKRDCWTSSP